MKLFHFGKKKEKAAKKIIEQEVIETSIDTKIEREETIFNSKEEQKRKIEDNCEQIMEASAQIEDARVEYQAVTAYLTDIQKIDLISGEDRQVIEDIARNIITFTRQRVQLQNRERKITDAQYRMMERNIEKFPKEIKSLKEKENYQLAIESDLRHLQAEKKALTYERKEIVNSQKYLKKLSIITSVLIISLFILFLFLAYALETDMTLPYLMTIIMAAVSTTYIFYEARKNRIEMILVEKKLSKAIRLLNRVKIKCFNNVNTIEYINHKFNIKNSEELQYIWERYIKAKEEEKQYKRNTELLDKYNNTLVEELKKAQIEDAEVWIYQAAAILDNKEMVEIRHRLNVRRQKLREKIDYNTQLRETNLEEIKDIIKQKPELKSEVVSILEKYNIIIK